MKIINRKLLIPFSQTVPRAGEGSTVELEDGRILIVYSRFPSGGDDHDYAELVQGILDPESGIITDGHVILAPDIALNQMSASLERLSDGGIGLGFVQKTEQYKSHVLFCRSDDEGTSWSQPVDCTAELNRSYPYVVCNNDRLRQFRCGRIAFAVNLYDDPAALTYRCSGSGRHSAMTMVYSDDNGRNWQYSSILQLKDEHIRPPHRLTADAAETWDEYRQLYDRTQEPGVEELGDGRIMMYCRTWLGYMYCAYSVDHGKTWDYLRAAPDLVSPDAPQSIRRIPGSNDLICIYNDRHEVSFGDDAQCWHWRTPLALAISRNHGATWQMLGKIENEDFNYCYTSILFKDDRIVLTDYQSENISPVKRLNLKSLAMQIIEI